MHAQPILDLAHVNHIADGKVTPDFFEQAIGRIPHHPRCPFRRTRLLTRRHLLLQPLTQRHLLLQPQDKLRDRSQHRMQGLELIRRQRLPPPLDLPHPEVELLPHRMRASHPALPPAAHLGPRDHALDHARPQFRRRQLLALRRRQPDLPLLRRHIRPRRHEVMLHAQRGVRHSLELEQRIHRLHIRKLKVHLLQSLRRPLLPIGRAPKAHMLGLPEVHRPPHLGQVAPKVIPCLKKQPFRDVHFLFEKLDTAGDG